MDNKIISYNNPQIKYIKKLLSSSRFRRKEGMFIIEGARLCLDAYKSGVEIIKLFYTIGAAKKYNKYLADVLYATENELISCDVLKRISSTESPQGIICICKIPDQNISLNDILSYSKIICLENIQDPSNLGTIIRTAEALGIKGIALSDGCCDLYNPKVLRGSMGAVFRAKCFNVNDCSNFIDILNNDKFTTYASVPVNDALKITEVDFNEKCAVFIGNEGNGLSNEIINKCRKKITIPMNGRAESLNAAAAANIIMWEIVRGV